MNRLTMWYDENQAISENEECSLSDCPFADPICEQVQSIIDRLAADVVPVVHSKVTHVEYDMPYCAFGICENCNEYIQAWNYCPCCGAKFDLK